MTTPPGWPFFAPAADGAFDAALDLAGLRPGEHLVDLGCGDGQVLLAAAQRGARVTGVESDEDLAAAARDALADAGVPPDRGRVVVADLFADFAGAVGDADVLFTYLSPATLQRLTPQLQRQPRRTRLVAVDFAVPDLVTAAEDGPAQLYRLPARVARARPGDVGWPADGHGTLCIAAAGVSSLSCLTAVHRGGPVRWEVTGDVASAAAYAVGADAAERGRPVAVDVRWRACPAGTVATGEVCVAGLPAHPLTVLFTDEDGPSADDDHGQWNLTEEGSEALAARLDDPDLPPPVRAADLLSSL